LGGALADGFWADFWADFWAVFAAVFEVAFFTAVRTAFFCAPGLRAEAALALLVFICRVTPPTVPRPAARRRCSTPPDNVQDRKTPPSRDDRERCCSWTGTA
jgi:hypothetical protein